MKRLSSEPQPIFTPASAKDGVVCSSGVLLQCNVMGGMFEDGHVFACSATGTKLLCLRHEHLCLPSLVEA